MRYTGGMRIACLFGALFIVVGIFHIAQAQSQSVVELEGKIADRNAKIEELEREIDGYQQELTAVGAEKQTLQSAVRTLDISRNKLGADIKITENRIYSTDLLIEELAQSINEQEEHIAEMVNIVGKTVRSVNEADATSLVEIILTYDRLSDFFDELETLQRFQTVLRDETKALLALKKSQEANKRQSEIKRGDLTEYKKQLGDQKYVLDITRGDKNRLLDTTKNKESEYQKILTEKIAIREQFERELFEFESQLKITIDSSRIPSVGKGVLLWPLDSVTITQYFGNTAFATENPQVYGGKGHNGIDLRASIGTRVKTALSGTVAGVGDTDTQRGCYSYGKWILVEHPNGLSTLYAHLSHISVSKGHSVRTGDVIGYSGATGYSTGPHLHFSVYATQGVQIVRLGDIKKITNCGNVAIPVADLKAYLNPLSYL